MSRYCLSRVLMVTAVVSCITISSAASAATLYEETFDIDVANTAAFTAQYSDWTVNGTDPLTVVGGVVTIPDNGANDTTTATRPGFAGEVIISADISRCPAMAITMSAWLSAATPSSFIPGSQASPAPCV